MEIQEYRSESGLPVVVGARVRHAELPEGTVVALPAASERVAVVQPREGGRSPYPCPVGHLVVLDLGDELAGVVRELWRLDVLGRQVGAVAPPIVAEWASRADVARRAS